LVVQTQQPLVVPDTSVETRFSEMPLIRRDGIESFCLLPLTTAHKRVGALGFGRRQRAAYPADEVRFLGDVAKLVAVAIENAMAFREIARLKDKLAEERVYLETEIRTEHTSEHIVGESPALRHTLQQVEIVAPTGSTVLLLGETGTGKELLARAIHDRSGRRDRTFVKLNCAAIPSGRAPSPGRSPRGSDGSRWPTAARFFSTRWARSRSSSSRSSSASSRSRSSSGSVARRPSR
jgi:formate hydrogenlyase transcriptional activator